MWRPRKAGRELFGARACAAAGQTQIKILEYQELRTNGLDRNPQKHDAVKLRELANRLTT